MQERFRNRFHPHSKPMPPNTDQSDHNWLLSDAGQEALNWASDLEGDALHRVTHLRKRFTATQAHLVTEQQDLRARAITKFSAADKMLFTRVGLEQASGEGIAAYKAQRFGEPGRIADLCCGIGGDAIALGQQGDVLAVDRDPAAAAFCQHNADVNQASVDATCALTRLQST